MAESIPSIAATDLSWSIAITATSILILGVAGMAALKRLLTASFAISTLL